MVSLTPPVKVKVKSSRDNIRYHNKLLHLVAAVGSEGTEDTSELTVGLFETVVKGSKLDQVKLWQLYVRGKDGSGEVSAEEFATPGLSSTVGGTANFKGSYPHGSY